MPNDLTGMLYTGINPTYDKLLRERIKEGEAAAAAQDAREKRRIEHEQQKASAEQKKGRPENAE